MSTLQTTYLQKPGAGTDAFAIPATDGTAGQFLTTDGNGALSFATVASLSNAEDGTGTDFEFNSGYGSNATAYGVRAWVNYDGTVATPSIRGDGNVSSVSDGGTGRQTVNFTTAMPDANYAVVSAVSKVRDSHNSNTYNPSFYDFATGSCKVATYNDSTWLDYANVSLAVIR